MQTMYNKFQYVLVILYAMSLLLNGCTEKRSKKNPAMGYREIPSNHSGIAFVNSIKETESQNILKYPYLYNGGGVAIGDLNNDGLPDIYFTGNMVGDKLYLNKGNLQFEDVTKSSGIISSSLWTTGVSFVDINNDGWLDIYVCRSGNRSYRNNLLYINKQNGRFEEKGKAYGLNDNGFSVQSYFFDYDLDGDLDMYLVNHSDKFFYQQEDLFKIKYEPDEFEADKLYKNNDGRFEDVGIQAGINHFGFGLSAAIFDYNDDGWPDIYVANDFFEPDYMYVNNGDGTFNNQLETAFGHTSFSSMGSDAADFNNDGLVDLMVCDMQAAENFRKKVNMASMDLKRFEKMLDEGYHYQYMQNTLQLNSGMGRFKEVAEYFNVQETDWSWGPLFFDMDNDGWKDLFVSNGIRRDIQYKDIYHDLTQKGGDVKSLNTLDIVENFPVYPIKNYCFKNDNATNLKDISENLGIDFEGFTTGAAYGDLDNDGDLDLVLNNLDDRAIVFENLLNSTNNISKNYLQLHLTGDKSNKFAYGARVYVYHNDLQQMQIVMPSRGFQSSSDFVVHFGMDNIKMVDSVEVVWPDSLKSIVRSVEVNQRVHLSYESSQLTTRDENLNKHLFQRIKHQSEKSIRHVDRSYNDYGKELLLPHKYSQLGPALAVGDVNNDELDDFYLGGAAGLGGQLFLQQKNGEFKASDSAPWLSDIASEDVGALFFDSDNDGDLDLYVTSGSNEWEEGSSKYQDRLYLNDGVGIFTKSKGVIPAMTFSSQVVSTSDFDDDGDLDLFVGGRLTPGNYPASPGSRLLINDNGKFYDKTNTIGPEILALGMVTAAEWVDYDNDDDDDLIVVGEWMPVTIFENNNGHLEKTSNGNLDQEIGWWYSLATGDMDNDGDIDIIVGNLGENYKYKASLENPFEIYSYDFDGNESNDIVLGYHHEKKVYPVRGKQCSSQQMPFINKKYSTYASFARSDLEEIYGTDKLNKAFHKIATNFASVYIENKGNGQFEIEKLPMPVQMSSTNAILVHDFNGDGNMDLLLAGNMFHAEAETARNDAGDGWYLKGIGKGKFEVIESRQSGFFVPTDAKVVKIAVSKNESKQILVGNNDDQLLIFSIAVNPSF